MQALNLPPFPLRTAEINGRPAIFDAFRRRYVALTPEEWVRQHFLHWLVSHKNYPAGRIAVEASLQYNKMQKRADAIVYGGEGQALMIIECKAPQVPVTQEVFDQIARYNFSFRVAYLAVTNGLDHYCCRWDTAGGRWLFLQDFPLYDGL
jgi:hypothetical protein